MEELKQFSTKHKIHVKLCLTLVKHGYKFVQTNDLGIPEGFCQECGHLIRYEQIYHDLKTNEVFSIGSNCMFKIYVLDHWRNQINEKDLENKDLQRAGKWLWIIHRDDYLSRIEEDLPQPKDYDNDFKKLADDLKVLVLRIRAKIKKEIAEENRIAEEEKRQKEREVYINRQEQDTQAWFVSEGIDISQCNDWERNFLDTMQEAYKKDWRLSDKQVDIFNKIKINKCIQKDVVSNQNLGSVAIVNDVSKKDDYSQLNDWEKNFMESIEKQVDLGRLLTQKQLNIMQKIDDKLSNGKETDEIVPIDVDEIVCNDREDDKGITIDVRGHAVAWNDNYDGYIGRKVNSWVINKLTGEWNEGIVNFVKKETDSAILCDVFVKNGSGGILVEETWIPKSQLVDDNFSL